MRFKVLAAGPRNSCIRSQMLPDFMIIDSGISASRLGLSSVNVLNLRAQPADLIPSFSKFGLVAQTLLVEIPNSLEIIDRHIVGSIAIAHDALIVFMALVRIFELMTKS